MNLKLRASARLATCLACLVAAPGHVLAQVVVGGGIGQLQIQVQGAAGRPAAAGEAGIDVEGDAIGDPWWDDAEVKRPAAADGLADPDDEAAGLQPNPQKLKLRMQVDGGEIQRQGLAVLRRELSVVRQTCPSLERQQRSVVIAAGRQAIEKGRAEHAEMLQGRRGGRPVDVATNVVDALRATVAANATADESAAYEAELALRRERSRQAAVALLVAEVDRHALLDDADREALRQAFAESYRERWQPAIRGFRQGAFFNVLASLPEINRCVEKAVGPDRTAEWLKRRGEAEKLAAAAGRPMQQMGAGPFQLRVEAFGDGKRQQVIVNGKQVFVGGAGGQVQVQIQAGGAVDIKRLEIQEKELVEPPAGNDAAAKPGATDAPGEKP